MNIYPFIEAEKVDSRNVARACELMEVSRSAYYQQRHQPPTARETSDASLTEEISTIHAESKGRYGAPRIYATLRRRGWTVSRKRVARLMRAAGLRGRTPKRWRKTTVPDPSATPPKDLVRRDFAVDPAQVNSFWCGDITYINTWQGWLYLATVLDLRSRRVVGFAMADHLRTDLIADALRNAVAGRDPEPGLVFHSDRGCQYTSRQYAQLATDFGVALSAGRTGQCWDNAVAESFFASLKGECIDQQPWPTHAMARRAVVDYIAWYNGTRLHSTLSYLTPNEYETITDQDQDQEALPDVA